MSITAFSWQPAPDALLLPANEVHVWRMPLDWPAAQVAQLRRYLNSEEQQRADRFHFPQHRAHYTAARAVLRILLGRYLQVAPQAVSFTYNAYGKPALGTADTQPQLHFNVSHSGALALYAFTYNRPVGVDVEQMRANVDFLGLSKQVFSAQEQQLFRMLPPAQIMDAFYNGWTRKEAFIKAKGMGLSLPLEQFDVTMTPGEPARLCATAFDPADVNRWSMTELAPGEGYKGALVVEGSHWVLQCWQLDPSTVILPSL
ncbi:MAG: 4'-phosphopantetheinyl transferase superfamily protein [Caldilineaceae bacterium]